MIRAKTALCVAAGARAGAPRRALRMRTAGPTAPVQYTTAKEAVSCIRSGDRVYVHSVCATPHPLVRAMCDRHAELNEVEVVHIHTEGRLPYADEPHCRAFRANNFFIGGNMRRAVNEGRADFVPVFLSEVGALFSTRLPLDVALLTVSPPDRHGFCSLGTSVDVSVDAMMAARRVVALVNPHMPRTHGEGLVHVSNLDVIVEGGEPLHEFRADPPTEVERKIGAHVAALVENGATLQMGIGAIPDAVLAQLRDHRDLGVHTEMFSEGIIDLVECGAVTNARKKQMPHVIGASFLMGSRRLFDWVDDNPAVEMRSSSYINDPSVIRTNPRVTAINSAIEVDLTGQVCADSIGTQFFSGVGGQMDFVRGAALSYGGKPIIALPSRTSKGEPRIVSTLRPGAGVVTTRAHVHWVVTEWGVCNLHGLNVRQRAEALISIAHPDDRKKLTQEAEARVHLHAANATRPTPII